MSFISRGLLIALSATLVPFALVAVGCTCGGADFEAGETEAALYLSDARTGDAIAGPVFKKDGVELDATCEADPQHRERCVQAMIVLQPGVHQIRIEADGYRAEEITVDTTEIASVHLAVALDVAE